MNIDDVLSPFRVFHPISDVLGIDYEQTSINDRVLMRKEYIDSLKKKDGEFIIAWDYLEYIPGRNSSSLEEGFPSPWWSKNYLISTCGKIAYVKRGKLYITRGKNKDGYFYHSVSNGRERKNIPVHRVVCSTYIPVDDLKPETKETVNHKNGNKGSNFTTNLEWATWEENIIHAIENDLYKNSIKKIKATYMLDDEHEGEIFYLPTASAAEQHGIDNAAILEAINYNYNCYGCSWEFAEDVPEDNVIPDWYLEVLKDKPYLSIRTKPILGTVVEGVLKGLKFVMFGDRELSELNALRQTVYKSCSGIRKSPYLGIRWKYISRLEAKKYQRGLSKEQISLLHS